jgi:HAD superfamily hydrolase (TIGR01509 family)
MSGWGSEADEVHEALWPRLTHRFASHELGLRKPDQQIYSRVEAKLGAIARPDEIVFFDDLADNVAAAAERAWRAELVRSKDNPVAEMRGALMRMGVL